MVNKVNMNSCNTLLNISYEFIISPTIVKINSSGSFIVTKYVSECIYPLLMIVIINDPVNIFMVILFERVTVLTKIEINSKKDNKSRKY